MSPVVIINTWQDKWDIPPIRNSWTIHSSKMPEFAMIELLYYAACFVLT